MILEKEIRDEIAKLVSIPVSLSTEAKDQEFPYIVIHLKGSTPNYTHDGQDQTKTKRVQINVFAKTYISAKTEAIKVYEIDKVKTNEIQFIKITNEVDDYDIETKTFGIYIDIDVKEGV